MAIDSRFSAKLLNGAIAGSVGTCCVFPLDLAKTRLQDQRTVNKLGGEVHRLYRNVPHCISQVVRAEGLRGLYRGLGVNLLLVNPEKAIKLAVNDQARVLLGAKQSFLPLHYEMLAGAVAGLCQVVITTPMELLKIQLQTAGRSNSNPSAQSGMAAQVPNSSQGKVAVRGFNTAAAVPRPPTGAMEVALRLINEKGIFGVYKGLGATLLRDVPFSLIYFPMFAYFNTKGYAPDGKRPHPVHSLVSGCGAGMLSALAVNPLDVIKTRLQVLNRAQGEPTYKGVLDCARKVYAQEGISAFYKGAVPRMIVIAPLFGIAQMVYFIGVAENIMDYMR